MFRESLRDLSDLPDLMAKVNAVSDVVNNRPHPLRTYDQIYMKAGELLLHIELLAPYLADKQVAFIGDGDAVALTLCHLAQLRLVPSPRRVTVLDFDERIVQSINSFAQSNRFADRINARLYNIADPLPSELEGTCDVFHTNPPYGSHNEGRSVVLFVSRGLDVNSGVI